ncbi:EAL domain-containing protein [Gloeothece verrucosa]|uniref:Diguanylate cyclase/phosphodiesterase n=1 Tax=Gloeothece verrucosa (strain PCC 7822) TaxID=497965 RepID=E0UJ35_GLOV7|nr:EAL domain-containing protein [Gloeothece verrucosa]ADN15738.1 diguanylate cyclase/phosphodiesterase [Gloeothece verrucosa PCC 7822]
MSLAKSQFAIQHLLIIEESKIRRSIKLEDFQYSLGRQASNNIVIKSQQVSRKHATFLRKSNQKNQYSYWIFDGDLEGNKSHNGIYINGEKCLIHELKDGDLINFGCEVNASYHVLYNSDKSSNLANFLTSHKQEVLESEDKLTFPNAESKEPTSFLFISEPHLAVSSEDTLSEETYLDPLTQLPNRNLFHEYLSIAIGNARQNKKPLAILYLDIEQLKDLNERWGNLIGDQVLQELAKQLKSCLRSGDIVARWGGDEFTILIPHINRVEDLPNICQRILNSVTQPISLERHLINIKINMGSAIYPEHGTEETLLLQKAEANLEENKQKSQETICVKKQQIYQQKSQAEKIKFMVKKAVINQDFLIYYQPQINIKTNKIEGVEALLRWHHPEFGSIAPNQFIPWVEKLDLVIPLTEWFIEKVARQHQAWRASDFSFIPISINLSSHQLQAPTLLSILNQNFLSIGLEGNLLIVEITEKTLQENPQNVFRLLHELKQLGIKACIDDFGSGTTSARHLQQFPFTQVKIAQSLLQNLEKYPEEISMIAAVIALGHTFKLKVIAEGVETENQLDILRKLDCDMIQGYVFSKPLNEIEATQFLSFYSDDQNKS